MWLLTAQWSELGDQLFPFLQRYRRNAPWSERALSQQTQQWILMMCLEVQTNMTMLTRGHLEGVGGFIL